MIPSFIGDMKRPQDFPKALYVSMTAELILFTLGGAIIYWQVGEEYITSPGMRFPFIVKRYLLTIRGCSF